MKSVLYIKGERMLLEGLIESVSPLVGESIDADTFDYFLHGEELIVSHECGGEHELMLDAEFCREHGLYFTQWLDLGKENLSRIHLTTDDLNIACMEFDKEVIQSDLFDLDLGTNYGMKEVILFKIETLLLN